jgi:hypothetical protein
VWPLLDPDREAIPHVLLDAHCSHSRLLQLQ